MLIIMLYFIMFYFIILYFMGGELVLCVHCPGCQEKIPSLILSFTLLYVECVNVRICINLESGERSERERERERERFAACCLFSGERSLALLLVLQRESCSLLAICSPAKEQVVLRRCCCLVSGERTQKVSSTAAHF